MQTPPTDFHLDGVDSLTGPDRYRNMQGLGPGILDYEFEERNAYKGVGKEC
jgi:hypothetical protein